MKKIINNSENLTEDKIDRTVNKVRAVILNKKGHILAAKYAGIFMLIGGSIEDGEDEVIALKREISEETGIKDITVDENGPFLEIDDLIPNYYDREAKRKINRQTNTKFYFVTTNENEINLEKTHRTEHEKNQNFTPFFVNPTVLEHMAIETPSDNPKNEVFKRELLTALREFTQYRREKEDKQK